VRVQSDNNNQIRYVNQPSRITSLLPMILMAVVLTLTIFILMAMGFKDAPFLSAGFTIVLFILILGGALGWVSDSRQRGRAHSEQLTTVHETVAQAVAPAVANAVMQLVGGIVAQSWPSGGAAPAQVINHVPPQAVTPRLPARVVSVPRKVVYNQAVPAGVVPYQPIEIETITGDDDETPGETIQVPMNHLMRFASCPTPARSEWQGKPQGYTNASRVFLSHGMLDRTSRGGFAWKPEYPVQSRRTWLAQYEAKALGAGADARETPLLGQ
jgi:hypothetical protein